jgi:hypothetical protein
MAHKLTIIAAIGLTASAVFMGAAAAIGGRDLGDGFEGFFDSRPRCEAIAGALASSRDLDWDGSDHVELALPAQASYSPGNGDKLHVTGDPQILAHLRVRDGDIELDCRGWRNRSKGLVITLPGRQFQKFAIAGGGGLTLDRLDQPRVAIEIAGSGSVKANGKIDDLKMEIAGSGDADFDQLTAREASVEIGGSGTVRAKGSIDDLKIEIAGSGRADFGQVTTRNAKVEIAGHGNVDIAPSEEAKIEIGGSGDVYLHSNPKRLETDIGGSGRIHRLPAGG